MSYLYLKKVKPQKHDAFISAGYRIQPCVNLTTIDDGACSNKESGVIESFATANTAKQSAPCWRKG